jgi:uncharacterized protein (DUF1684 family)
MKRFALVLALLPVSYDAVFAQSHQQEIARWQKHYKEEFIEEPRSPLKAKDTGFLRFYPVAKKWAVRAEVVPIPDAKPIEMATHAGITKKFRPYALLRFANPTSRGVTYDSLIAYESLRGKSPDTLVFIPFNDETNGADTYGGGRYMDIPKRLLSEPRFLLDFNKAYNPWCVFASGYSCPIPPTENRLGMHVEAGELLPDERIRAKE